MTILCLDCETTGFTKSLPPTDESQPHLVQVSAILMEEDGRELACFDRIIKPEGFTIDEEGGAFKAHRITNLIAQRDGVPRKEALKDLLSLADRAHLRVAHNVSFDAQIVLIAMYRAGFGQVEIRRWENMPQFCTMQRSRDLCRIPLKSGKGWKTPKLDEALEALTGDKFEGAAHDSLYDVRALSKVYLAINRRMKGVR